LATTSLGSGQTIALPAVDDLETIGEPRASNRPTATVAVVDDLDTIGEPRAPRTDQPRRSPTSTVCSHGARAWAAPELRRGCGGCAAPDGGRGGCACRHGAFRPRWRAPGSAVAVEAAAAALGAAARASRRKERRARLDNGRPLSCDRRHV